MRGLIAFGAALWMATASMGAAQNSPVVVELFTSQGCSSCPPADELLHQLAERDDVIPLALHIDYWDYIGWKDAFANAAFTKRQKAYARAASRKMIYTPQMIIDGRDDVVGNRPMDVAEMIAKRLNTPSPVSVSLSRDSGRLHITAASDHAVGQMDVFMVRYTPTQRVDIKRGENAGRSIVYSHIVTDWRNVGKWDGKDSFKTSAKISGDAPVVVLIQSSGTGPILAAARLR